MLLVYITIAAMYVSSVVGYGLTHYGAFKSSQPETKEFFWYYLLVNALWHNVITIKMNYASFKLVMSAVKLGSMDKEQMRSWWNIWEVFNLTFNVSRMLTTNVFPHIILFSEMGDESKKYFNAIHVISASFDLMYAISQIPGWGLFLHMMKSVSKSICRFFASYFWHFLGYAIAFHIIMPDEGAFKNVSDSIIKVLTSSSFLFDIFVSKRPNVFRFSQC